MVDSKPEIVKIEVSDFNTFPLKPVVGDWMSSDLTVSFNFDIFGKYLNESYGEHSID